MQHATRRWTVLGNRDGTAFPRATRATCFLTVRAAGITEKGLIGFKLVLGSSKVSLPTHLKGLVLEHDLARVTA